MSRPVEACRARMRCAAALSGMATADARFFTDEPRGRTDHVPATDAGMASCGLAHYHGGDPSKPVVYEGSLRVSAAGSFRSNLDGDARATDRADDSGYNTAFIAGQIGHHIHDPYDLYQKAAS